MEFLSRLIGGTGARSTKKTSNQPQQRLVKFKKIYNQTLELSHRTNGEATEQVIVDQIQVGLQRLISLLQDDTRAPAPHLCLTFAASSYVYTAVSRIAQALKNEAVTREAVAVFTILVDSDEENLLATERFAETMMAFVDKILGYDSHVVTSETQSEALEMIFGIAAKIRLEPELLPVWFRKRPDGDDAGKAVEAFGDGIEQDDFPLCHQFVAHVYHEGRAGDFARTGLLYTLESASNSLILERWIAASDLPTLMASGLGALYSQLSRKLTIARPAHGLPLVLALSDLRDLQPSKEAESFLSEELQGRLATFMSYMVFWQDVLEHCHSADIKATLLDRFQEEFLQQILYPSLLESSDVDGGSSVAVLTYLCRILDSVSHPDLIHLILHYLLALSEPISTRPATPRSSNGKRAGKNGSADVIKAGTTLNPIYFNLTDLVLANCKSRFPETVTAALRLVTVILSKHHAYAVDSLVTTIRLPDAVVAPTRSVGAAEGDVTRFIELAREMGGPDGMDAMYEANLKDSLMFIEAHACSEHVLALPTSGSKNGVGGKGTTLLKEEKHAMQMHSMSPEDPLLKQFNALLQTFLTNDVETNLALTSAISQLALCPFVKIEGWLVAPDFDKDQASDVGPGLQTTADNEEDADAVAEMARIRAFRRARRQRAEGSGTTSSPPMLQTLEYLNRTIGNVRADVAQFDALVAGRKRAFQGVIELENEGVATPSLDLTPRRSVDVSRDASMTRGLPIPGSSATAMKRPTAAPPPLESLSVSPRGRALSMITGSGRMGQAGASPTKTNASRRPTPLDSPALHSLDHSRRASKSPVKSARALSPLSAHMDAEEALFLGAPTLSPAKAKFVDEEVFDRKIRIPPYGDAVKVDVLFDTETAANDVNEVAEDGELAVDKDGKAGKEDAEGEMEKGEGEGLGDLEGQEEEAAEEEEEEDSPVREATLTHVLTNVVILQEFVLELAAVMHVRAGLIDGDVGFG